MINSTNKRDDTAIAFAYAFFPESCDWRQRKGAIIGYVEATIIRDEEVEKWKDEYNNLCKFATDYENQAVDLKSKLARAVEALTRCKCELAYLIAQHTCVPGGSVDPAYQMAKKALAEITDTGFSIKADAKYGAGEAFQLNDSALGGKLAESDVYYNHGDDPIFITTKFVDDKFGGPGKPIKNYCIAKGQGIDIKITGMTREKPVTKSQTKAGSASGQDA